MGYYSAVQLDKEPFSTSPDPRFFYRSTEHLTALNRLEISVRLKRGLSVILGDVGTGKTTLSRALFQAFTMEEDYEFHMILNPSFDSEENFLIHLTKLFGANTFNPGESDHRNVIEKYLYHKNIEEQKTVVLVIDEAQKLAPAYLETLRTFLNYETNEYKFLQLVLLGQLELWSQIREMDNFRDRINFKFLLRPLDEFETGEMVRYRLKAAGCADSRQMFTPDAIHLIYKYSRGRPRRINMVCHMAVERLVMEDRRIVTAGLVGRIIDEDKKWEW
ncbi:MAG: AAA family ATPase [Candidatus Omnitrophica bacterium]|nr:AAA family ATPase [Candidatus Omnitrophota bacterium]